MPLPAAVSIQRESPRQPEVMRMIADLDAHVASLYPPESNHLLDADALCAPEVRFFVARIDGAVVGCGALRMNEAGYAELKRIFVRSEQRGKHVGRAIMEHLEAYARAEGVRCIRLETGTLQAAALKLYRAAGYTEIPAFGSYAEDPLSVFMEKAI